jgi:pyrroline-5-carboxylate reductase
VHDLFSTVGFAVEVPLERLLNALMVSQVPEIHIDPVTGLSGSGPSYVNGKTGNNYLKIF